MAGKLAPEACQTAVKGLSCDGRAISLNALPQVRKPDNNAGSDGATSGRSAPYFFVD
jgi:hypothetical protein